MPFLRLRLGLFVVILLVAFGSAYRYLFFFTFGDIAETPVNVLLKAFYVGFKLDLRLAVLTVVPFFAVAWIPKLNPTHSSIARKFWSVHFAVLTSLVLLVYIADLGHYDYLQVRIDASAFRFIENPLISMQMVWETYSVLPALLLFVALSMGVFFAIKWLFYRTPNTTALPTCFSRRVIITAATVFFMVGIYGKFSYYPLRWSDAYFSTAQFPAHLALNPVLNIVDTFATAENEAGEPQRVRANYNQLATYLGVEKPNPETLDFSRRVRPTPLAPGRPNVVVIMMESFAAHLTGFYGNPLSASPEFDRIADGGLAFNRYYTPGVGTAHGVYTMLTGIPDVSLNRTASRNPNAIKQHIILNEFEGYQKFYFLGGSANWANIRALLQHNIKDLQLYEEGDFPNSPRTDVWGISDLHLFEEANRVLRDKQDPFFAFIHLSGNHRPYTIPDDNRDFVPVTIDDDVALENGFDLVDGFNSFRFMDHSLGIFMKLAQEEEYFENTLFILTADNGETGNVPGPLHPEEAPRLSYHHAPFVIFGAPLNRKAEQLDVVGTQMDLMPTIAGAIGVAAQNVTLGRNLLDPSHENGYAFIHRRWGTGSELVALDDQYLLFKNPGAGSPTLHTYHPQDQSWKIVNEQPTRAEVMADFADGIYDTSKYMLFGAPR